MEGLEPYKPAPKKTVPEWWPADRPFVELKPMTLYRDNEGRWRGPTGPGGEWVTTEGRYYGRDERRAMQRRDKAMRRRAFR